MIEVCDCGVSLRCDRGVRLCFALVSLFALARLRPSRQQNTFRCEKMQRRENVRVCRVTVVPLDLALEKFCTASILIKT